MIVDYWNVDEIVDYCQHTHYNIILHNLKYLLSYCHHTNSQLSTLGST